MAPTATREELEHLRRFFATLLGHRDAYAKVTVSVQGGRVAMVHLDRSYKLEELPTTTGHDDAP